MNGVVIGTITAVAVAATVPGVIKASIENNKPSFQKTEIDEKEE